MRTLALLNLCASLVLFVAVCSALGSDALEFASRYVLWALAAGAGFAGALFALSAAILIRE
jgi:hypothetical protein